MPLQTDSQLPNLNNNVKNLIASSVISKQDRFKYLLEFSWKGIAYIKSLPMLIMNNRDTASQWHLHSISGTLTGSKLRKRFSKAFKKLKFSRSFYIALVCEEV